MHLQEDHPSSKWFSRQQQKPGSRISTHQPVSSYREAEIFVTNLWQPHFLPARKQTIALPSYGRSCVPTRCRFSLRQSKAERLGHRPLRGMKNFCPSCRLIILCPTTAAGESTWQRCSTACWSLKSPSRLCLPQLRQFLKSKPFRRHPWQLLTKHRLTYLPHFIGIQNQPGSTVRRGRTISSRTRSIRRVLHQGLKSPSGRCTNNLCTGAFFSTCAVG